MKAGVFPDLVFSNRRVGIKSECIMKLTSGCKIWIGISSVTGLCTNVVRSDLGITASSSKPSSEGANRCGDVTSHTPGGAVRRTAESRLLLLTAPLAPQVHSCRENVRAFGNTRFQLCDANSPHRFLCASCI